MLIVEGVIRHGTVDVVLDVGFDSSVCQCSSNGNFISPECRVNEC